MMIHFPELKFEKFPPEMKQSRDPSLSSADPAQTHAPHHYYTHTHTHTHTDTHTDELNLNNLIKCREEKKRIVCPVIIQQWKQDWRRRPFCHRSTAPLYFLHEISNQM